MTYEEARNMIISAECWGKDSTECNFYMNNDGMCDECVYTTIIDALEKQIPKKPKLKVRGVYDDDSDDYLGEEEIKVCPSCRITNQLWRGFSFCQKCGQAIDWSEVE